MSTVPGDRVGGRHRSATGTADPREIDGGPLPAEVSRVLDTLYGDEFEPEPEGARPGGGGPGPAEEPAVRRETSGRW